MGAPYSAILPEGTYIDRQLILTVNATDLDSGTNAEITYSIAGGMAGSFQIDPLTVSLRQCIQAYPIFQEDMILALMMKSLVPPHCEPLRHFVGVL